MKATALLAVVGFASTGCPRAGSSSSLSPTPPGPAIGTPGPERVDLGTVEVRVRPPHPSMIVVAASPVYDGPPATATFADKAPATNSAIRAVVRERLAAIAEERAIHAAYVRDRTAIRSDPDFQAKALKLLEARDTKLAKANARLTKASDRLRTLLEKHDTIVTIDGAVLGVELSLEIAESEFDRALEAAESKGTVGDVKIDVADARARVDRLFERFPDASQHAEARLVRALVYHADDRRTGALLYVQFARDFPQSKHVESAYHVAGDYLYGDLDPLARANADEAFRWLSDHATTDAVKSIARFRIGQMQYRARAWPEMIDTMCRIVDDPKAELGLAGDALGYLPDAILRRGLPALSSACAAHACPCRADVLVHVVDHYRRLEDTPNLIASAALARSMFPSSEFAAQWACDAGTATDCPTPPPRTEGTDAEHARADLEGTAAISSCVAEGLADQRMRLSARFAFEVVIGEHGKTTSVNVVDSTLDPDTRDCIVGWIERHRWRDLDKLRIAAQLAIHD